MNQRIVPSNKIIKDPIICPQDRGEHGRAAHYAGSERCHRARNAARTTIVGRCRKTENRTAPRPETEELGEQHRYLLSLTFKPLPRHIRQRI